MNKELLCTLGPASLNDRVIHRLEALGVSLFRINLSHVKLGDLADTIEFVKNRTSVPICLDTEGAQIRTGDLATGNISIKDNAILRISRKSTKSDLESFAFYPDSITDLLSIGDLISIDFHSVLAQVIDYAADHTVLRVLNGGDFGSNKAVSIDRHIEMPPLTQKDCEAIKIGRDYDIRHVALSFANRGSDVDQIRELAGTDASIIAKIECRNGLINLKDIAEKADALLIDRGDLSREIPIEQIPLTQKMIMSQAQDQGRKVYVATNLLESMVTEPSPTRAEVNDVFNTLLDGADGLVLAAETAIGAHPIGCASMIVKLVQQYESRSSTSLSFQSKPDISTTSLLVDPHGGRLVNCERLKPDDNELIGLQSLSISEKALIDCEQIGIGTYSPLQGFMDRDTVENVLTNHRLCDDTVWTMPILLPFNRESKTAFDLPPEILLTDMEGVPRALLKNAHAYEMNLEDLAKRWFGTVSLEHPGVAEVMSGNGWFLAGSIILLKSSPTRNRNHELTPLQARNVFTHKGWSKIVGFHSRNVIHRAHEHIMSTALETSMADGLLLSPLTGPMKPGDFVCEAIVKSYQTMLTSGLLPFDQAVLSTLMTYPRYAGPREAIFTALCRKNMGCSHFIIGRDHAGVGAFYTNQMMRELFDKIGDIGIEPIFFEEIAYNTKTDTYEPLNLDPTGLQMISGTEARNALRENKPLPNWYMRQIIQDQLRDELKAGRPIFND